MCVINILPHPPPYPPPSSPPIPSCLFAHVSCSFSCDRGAHLSRRTRVLPQPNVVSLPQFKERIKSTILFFKLSLSPPPKYIPAASPRTGHSTLDLSLPLSWPAWRTGSSTSSPSFPSSSDSRTLQERLPLRSKWRAMSSWSSFCLHSSPLPGCLAWYPPCIQAGVTLTGSPSVSLPSLSWTTLSSRSS